MNPSSSSATDSSSSSRLRGVLDVLQQSFRGAWRATSSGEGDAAGGGEGWRQKHRLVALVTVATVGVVSGAVFLLSWMLRDQRCRRPAGRAIPQPATSGETRSPTTQGTDHAAGTLEEDQQTPLQDAAPEALERFLLLLAFLVPERLASRMKRCWLPVMTFGLGLGCCHIRCNLFLGLSRVSGEKKTPPCSHNNSRSLLRLHLLLILIL